MRAGVLKIPAAHQHGLTRVIVRLDAPPLAAWSSDRSLSSSSRSQHLNVLTSSSKAYLAKLARLQDAAVAQVRTAIPQARFQERFSILLDGITVQLPVRSLPKLLSLSAVNKVYPSLTYTRTMDRGPSVIHATDLEAATGDKGQGMKIGVVDTGVDSSSPFLNPAGFAYPPGFPKGDTKLTTPKVIVAKVFPGPVRDSLSNKAFDPTEPHGTHVSGIAAGDEGTTAPAGPIIRRRPTFPVSRRRRGSANYRVFTVPTPLGHEADTPEIVKAFEAAVADGMNVINFSGGGPETDPANDAMNEAVHNTALAGVVPVIAAGNDREDFGLGTAGSPGTAPDAISVAAVSNTHVFATGAQRRRRPTPARSRADPGRRRREAPRSHGRPSTRRSSTSPRSSARTANRSKPTSADPRPIRIPGSARCRKAPWPARSPLVSRGVCSFVSKAERAGLAGAIGIILVDNRFGEANPIPIPLPIPAGMISDLDGLHLRAFLATTGGRAAIRVSSDVRDRHRPQWRHHELLVGRPDRLRLRPQARHLGAGPRRALIHASAHHRVDVLGLRGHLDGDAARRGRGRVAPPATPDVVVVAGEVGADVDGRPSVG